MNRSRSVKMIAFWDIRPCSLTVADKRFRGAHCVHHLGDKRIFEFIYGRKRKKRRLVSACFGSSNKAQLLNVDILTGGRTEI
jgi:hypothetical protein